MHFQLIVKVALMAEGDHFAKLFLKVSKYFFGVYFRNEAICVVFIQHIFCEDSLDVFLPLCESMS